MQQIIKRLITAANVLDSKKYYAEADVITKLAQQLYLPEMKPRIKTTYDIVTPESAEAGDFEESGWDDEEGVIFDPDEYDTEEGKTTSDLAAEWLENKGASEPSSSPYSRGTWYTAHDDMDYTTGDETSHNYHLEGFDDDDERKIYERLMRKK